VCFSYVLSFAQAIERTLIGKQELKEKPH